MMTVRDSINTKARCGGGSTSCSQEIPVEADLSDARGVRGQHDDYPIYSRSSYESGLCSCRAAGSDVLMLALFCSVS